MIKVSVLHKLINVNFQSNIIFVSDAIEINIIGALKIIILVYNYSVCYIITIHYIITASY